MSLTRTAHTARRVLLQLRHDPRTVVLMLVVPCVLETLLRLIYAHHRAAFDQAGAPLLAFFPLTTVFLVTSIALLREQDDVDPTLSHDPLDGLDVGKRIGPRRRTTQRRHDLPGRQARALREQHADRTHRASVSADGAAADP